MIKLKPLKIIDEHRVLAASTLVTILLTFILSARRVALYDFNFIANAVHRISIGEIPYKDFDLVLPPVTFLPVYLVHHFLGLSIVVSMLISAIATQVIAIIAFYNILLRLKNNTANSISGFLFALAMTCAAAVNVISVYPNYIYDSVASALTLVTIAFLLKYLESKRYRFLVLSYALAILTLMTKFNMGGSLITAVVLVRVVTLLKIRQLKQLLLEVLTLFTLSVCSIILVSFAGLSNFIDQTVIAPRDFKGVTSVEQLVQYKYPLLLGLLVLTLLASKVILIRRLVFEWTLSILVIFLAFILFLTLFTPYSSGTIMGRLFPSANFAYPIVLLLALNRLICLQKLRSELVLLLVVIPIYFFGTFLSQGWNGSSYSLNPLLILLLISLYLTSDGTERRQFKGFFILLVLLVSANSLTSALNGNRLGYVIDNGARGKSFNWSQIGIASSSEDIEQTSQIREFLMHEEKNRTLVEFPAEDSLDQFSTQLIPWSRCLQFTYVCPSKPTEQIIKDFKKKVPDFVILKIRTQINRDLEPIVSTIESVVSACYTEKYSNKNYLLFETYEDTQICVDEYLKRDSNHAEE